VNEEFDLHRSLANALSLMHASAGGKALALSLEIAPDMPQMMVGDRLRLRQVLANLIGNAIKFTEAGQIVVAAGHEGEILEIRVTDTGIGIPEAQQAAVFEEFVQANAHITSSYGGTGLGLSISRRIAEAMGGTLTLTSRQGAGTTLILRIPAQFVRAPAKPLPAPTSLADEGAGKALRILVAEDNLTNQIIINAMLQRLGHSVALAETGKEAIALVEQNILAETPFDLILMDVQMPEMNGIDATARLRMMGFTAGQLPIIAVTANAYLDDIAICLAAGMQAHLTKPLRLVDLKTALAQWGQAAAAPGPHGAPPQPIRAELANEP